MKIKYKLNIVFTLISVVVIIISALIFLNLSIGAIKENQLRNLVKERIKDIEFMRGDILFYELLKTNWANNEYVEEILKNKINLFNNNFSEIFILDPSGKIIFSTDQTQKWKIKNDKNYFTKGKNETFVQDFYYSPSTQKPTMIISTPVKDANQNLISIIVGRVNLESISDIMLERSGLGETGKTYLVNKINIIFTKPLQNEEKFLGKTIYTPAIKECISGKNNYGKYKNYKNVSVLGIYKWIPGRDVCLLAEIDETEALAITKKLGQTITFINLVIVFLLIIINLFLTKKITDPIKYLKNAASKFGSGKMQQKPGKQNKRTHPGTK